MKTYPSIPSKIPTNGEYIAFAKIDGSNIRAEWSKKTGFYKFGTRTRLLGEDQPQLTPSRDLIMDRYADELEYRFNNAKYDRAVCYFEYAGPNSFAGFHSETDIENGLMNATLFDIAPYKKGFMGPVQFIDFCSGLPIPAVLFRGDMNEEFVEDVRQGMFIDHAFEGVILKEVKEKHFKAAKIKTIQWLDKLKLHCGQDDKMFERLK